jgi:hypothetical protein
MEASDDYDIRELRVKNDKVRQSDGYVCTGRDWTMRSTALFMWRRGMCSPGVTPDMYKVFGIFEAN